MSLPNTESYIGNRVTATIIDYIIVFGITILYIFSFGTRDEQGTYVVTGLPALVPFLFWFFYFIMSEYFLKGTLGHLIMKLKVVSLKENNPDPEFGQIFLRRICDILEIVWCFGLIAYLVAKNTNLNQRLGDLIAKTIITGNDQKHTEHEFEFENSISESQSV